MAHRISTRAMRAIRAQSELERTVLDFAEERELTNVELLQALVSIQQGVLKYMLRAERHPEDPDRPAALE